MAKEKEDIEIKLDLLKSIALQKAPELLSFKPNIKWDETNLDKLPEEFYKTVVNTTELNNIYRSALGKTFIKEHGLSCQESVAVAWKPLKKGGKS